MNRRSNWERNRLKRRSISWDSEEGMKHTRWEYMDVWLKRCGKHGKYQWLHCVQCSSFFQVKDLLPDRNEEREACPFCSSAGFDIAITQWNKFQGDTSAWPKSIAELHYGMKWELDEKPVIHMGIQGLPISKKTSPLL